MPPLVLKWLIPALIGVAGNKIRNSSEGVLGTTTGALLELGGLGNVSGKLGGIAAQKVGGAMAKTALPEWAGKTASSLAQTTAAMAPFGASMAYDFSQMPQGSMVYNDDYGAEADPEMMAAIGQLLQQHQGAAMNWQVA